MTSPAANDPTVRYGLAAFHTLLEEAVQESAKLATTAGHALRNGISPNQIIDYVRGHLDEAGRADVHGQLTLSPWAMGRVVALVKARRDPSSLGARILATTGPVVPHHWGIPRSQDPDADLARLLDAL